MTTLTWLHLSDWHQNADDSDGQFDRQIVLDALIADIQSRCQIDSTLENIDFVVFSGDLSFSGKIDEFDLARDSLVQPVLDAVGLDPDNLIIVPGNHDLNRSRLEMLPPGLQKPLLDDVSVQKWLKPENLARTLEPFENFREFVKNYSGQSRPHYRSIVRRKFRDIEVAFLGLNSSWMNARNPNGPNEFNDYGFSVVGERQFHSALSEISDADVRIVVIHHPFDWLIEFDRNRIESRLLHECHFILRGHTHMPQVNITRGTLGDCVIIPAGASYDRRVASNPRYTNAYNFVHLDLDLDQGFVFLRRWSEQANKWIQDIESYPNGKVLLDGLPVHSNEKTSFEQIPLGPDDVEHVLDYFSAQGYDAHELFRALAQAFAKKGDLAAVVSHLEVADALLKKIVSWVKESNETEREIAENLWFQAGYAILSLACIAVTHDLTYHKTAIEEWAISRKIAGIEYSDLYEIPGCVDTAMRMISTNIADFGRF